MTTSRRYSSPIDIRSTWLRPGIQFGLSAERVAELVQEARIAAMAAALKESAIEAAKLAAKHVASGALDPESCGC